MCVIIDCGIFKFELNPLACMPRIFGGGGGGGAKEDLFIFEGGRMVKIIKNRLILHNFYNFAGGFNPKATPRHANENTPLQLR